MKTIIACMTVGLALMAGHVAAQQPSTRPFWQVGRYQLEIAPNGTVYMVDTVTGQCWSKVGRGRWFDEGNPALPDDPVSVEKPIHLDLPDDVVQLTVRQRRFKFIPGTDNRVALRIDDITGGQVVVSIHDDQGNVLLDDVSCEPGDVQSFEVGEQTCFVMLKELKNFLIGEDLALLELSTNQSLLEPLPAPEAEAPQITVPEAPDQPEPANRQR